eukprot:7659977-Pyramimonas_sp.AAC.1
MTASTAAAAGATTTTIANSDDADGRGGTTERRPRRWFSQCLLEAGGLGLHRAQAGRLASL